MKILIISNSAGGLYSFRKELFERLCNDKNEVVFTTPSDDAVPDLQMFGAEYIEFNFSRRGKNPFADLAQYFGYKKIIKKTAPDVILTYTIKPNVWGGMAARHMKVPYIANVTGLGTAVENGGIMQMLTTTLYKMGLRGASCVFFQNKSNCDKFVKEKLVGEKHRVIPGSGVNTLYHAYSEYPESDEFTKFLFIGRVMKDKGICELLDAMERIHEKYPNTFLDILGGSDEDYSARLDECEKKGFLKYHGSVKDVRPFIHECHCTVLPSYHEGTANVLLESASAGRPVISTRVPGCAETYDENVTGFGSDVKSADSLYEAMERFICLPYEEKKQMGIKGREKVIREYDRNIVIEAYLEEISKAKKD